MSSDATATGKPTRVNISISQRNMLTSMVLRKPPAGELPITIEEVMQAVQEAGVVYGLAPAAIEEALEKGDYHAPIPIANGLEPVAGVHSRFEYHFDTTYDHSPTEDENGHIDYRNINFIQNAEKDQVLVSRIPPTAGTPGTSVLGRVIKALPGREMPFKRGLNTVESEDGKKLLATTAGAIQFKNNLVSILDVLVILGDVDHKVGNLDCRGSVRVTGDVKAGFRHKIDGDLEVIGNMEDCEADVGGSIYLKGGFFGNGKNQLRAGGDIVLKFAEGQRMHAGNEIHVGGELINCIASAGEAILVKSRQGRIVGGEIEAGHEIRTGFLGSDAQTTTLVSIAAEPELLASYTRLKEETDRLASEHRRVKEALYSLYRIQLDKKLSPAREKALAELEEQQKELPDQIEQNQNKLAEAEEAIARIKEARIIVEKSLYPGVIARFGSVSRQIASALACCQISLMGEKVVISKYVED